MLRFNDLPLEQMDYIKSKDCLFHFTKKNIAIEHILHELEFKLNVFSKTNDPQEYKEKLTGVTGFGLGKERLKIAMKIKDQVNKILLENTGFASFCMNTHNEHGNIESYGLLKSRMWSQYGDNHGGVCILFSKESLNSKIKNNFESKDYIHYCGEVSYHNFFIGDDSFFETTVKDIDNDNEVDNANKYIEKNYNNLLFRKQVDYKDEKEFRICVTKKMRI